MIIPILQLRKLRPREVKQIAWRPLLVVLQSILQTIGKT